MDTPKKLFVTVKGACWKGNKLLLQNEHKEGTDELWDLPGGRMDEGDSIEDALRREFQEELGVAIEIISKLPIKVWQVETSGEPVMALLYEVKLEAEDFSYTTSKSQEVFDAKWMSKEEFEPTVDFSHKQAILEYFDEHSTINNKSINK